MHIVDTTMFFCPRSGGVKRYLLAKHSWLQQHQRGNRKILKHTLLVPAPQPAADDVVACRTLAIPLIDGYRFPLSITGWRDALLRLAPDLIEAADPYVPLIAARAAGQRLGVPVVAFFHSDLSRMLSQRVGKWIAPIARRYLRTLYRGVDLVLAPSHVMLETLRESGITNTALQPLGVDTQIFNPERKDSQLRSQLGLPTNTRLLIYAGRFAREKNLPLLLQAVERLGAPYHLLLVGGERDQRLSRHATILSYEAQATDLARVMASCDVFVHAGDQETFGLVALEAMAAGLPVVAANHGGLAELVSDREGATVQQLIARDYCEAITQLFERDIATIGTAARERVMRNYSWDSAFRQLMMRYSHVVAKPHLVEHLLSPVSR